VVAQSSTCKMPKASKKDPHKPKRALTGFMYFSQEFRPEVIASNPNIKFGDVGKMLGVRWGELSDEEKTPFLEKANLDKERYHFQMSSYIPDPEYAKKSKRRDPNKPKRAMSAYLYFCNAKRDTVQAGHPEKKMTDIQKLLGDLWKDTSDAERVPYTKQAEADRRRYDEEITALNKSNTTTQLPMTQPYTYEDDDEGGLIQDDSD